MAGDSLTDWEKSGLKSASAHLIRRLGGFDLAEMIGGRSRSTLHSYTDLRSDAFMPVDVVLRLERGLLEIGGQPLISPLLARGVHHMQVPIPRGEGVVAAMIGPVLRQAAEIAAQHVEATADGVLTDAERAEGAAHADRLIALATQLRAAYAPEAPGLRAVA
jgi:hypothetical protein